jgi:hypothetical protein
MRRTTEARPAASRRPGLRRTKSLPATIRSLRRGSTGAGVSIRVVASALATIAASAAIGGPASAAPSRHSARIARTLNIRDEAHLRFITGSGSELIDEGRASGTIPGWVKARFTYNGEPTVSASLTIYGQGGSISARGSGRLSNPTSPSPSFRGHLSLTRGSGRYAHAHGGGEVFGVFNRRSYGLIVQAIGKLYY